MLYFKASFPVYARGGSRVWEWGGKVGARSARVREILLINIHYSLKSLDFIA